MKRVLGAVSSEAPRLGAIDRYRLRSKRRRFLWRAIRARGALTCLADRTSSISSDDILAVCVVRNEVTRLPYFLDHCRALGIDHFLVVDNGSDDGTVDLLRSANDISLWQTEAGYRAARFGLDWASWLLMRHGHGHWCLTVDADELLIYSGWPDKNLRAVTRWLDAHERPGLGCLMLDLYPKGPLGAEAYEAGQDPTEVVTHFDAGPYRVQRQIPMDNLWVQGGVRERVFFPDDPQKSPTLNKIPLVKWHWRMAYANSTHSLLPREMNRLYNGPGGSEPSGALLHTKFLPEVRAKSVIEQSRQQHFHDPTAFDDYYDQIVAAPTLWTEGSFAFEGAAQLAELGLITACNWSV